MDDGKAVQCVLLRLLARMQSSCGNLVHAFHRAHAVMQDEAVYVFGLLPAMSRTTLVDFPSDYSVNCPNDCSRDWQRAMRDDCASATPGSLKARLQASIA